MSATTASPPYSAPATVEEKSYRVGTLAYSQRDLYVLFVWLMWNEFTVVLLQDPPAFGAFLQKDFGATNFQISIFGTIGTAMTILINPVFSTWSDRTRTRWGRRRPFLAAFTPPLAAFTMLLPFMPDLAKHFDHVPAIHAIAHWFGTPISAETLSRFPWLNVVASLFPWNFTVLMVTCCGLCISFFNSIVGTLFSYLYWDVVPQSVLGRWTSLNKMVAAGCQFIWLFFLFGLATHHMKALCIGASLFALTVYLLSIYMVKEGSYPPVDRHEKGPAVWTQVRAYFVECYSKPYYLWIFAAFAFASINWGTGFYMDFYLRYNLGLDYDAMGPIKGVPGILTIVLGYFLGSMADKLHPMRVFVPTYLTLAVIYVLGFIFIHDKWSYLFFSCVIQVAQFANQITYGALLPQIFPREKFGQFCSANAITSMAVNMLLGLVWARMFDLLHSQYRYAYIIAACSMFGAGLLFIKVRHNFNRRHGHVPVPHAG